MQSDNHFTLESKHRFLKQQLIALGYEYEFTIDSVPLLENLVADLIQTTDTLKHYKELSQGCLKACHDLETFVDAYKKDNAWLIRELNSLHLNAVSERLANEKKISDLERRLKCTGKVITESSNVSKGRTRYCHKVTTERSDVSGTGCKNLKEKCNHYEDIIKNKDSEIQQLYSEILRLNNLLTDGRPIEAILNELSQDYGSTELFHIQQKNADLQQHLNEAMIGQHEAKRNALKLADCYHCCQRENTECLGKCYSFRKNQHKTDVSQEKLKQIEDELHTLKSKYQTIETEIKNKEKINSESQYCKFTTEISSLKEVCNNLENEKSKLRKELDELRLVHESATSLNQKGEKELLELKRSYQETVADNAEKEKVLKKCLDEKKYLSNRVQELSIIERDLTLEITRLCNINAVHKRHILELESRLLELYQNKYRENVPLKSSLQISKKPLGKKPAKPPHTGLFKNGPNKENERNNEVTDGNITETKSLSVLKLIREKYNKQIDSIQEEQRCSNENAPEFNLASTEEKNQKITSLEKLLKDKEVKIWNLEQVIEDFRKQLNSQTDSRRSPVNVDQLRVQINNLEKSRNDTLAENRQLQKDLNALTQDYLACKNELEKVSKEMEDLNIKVHDYIATPVNADQLRIQINNLEKTRNDTLAENRRLQKDLNALTQDYLACKNELEKARKETQDLTIQVHDYIAKVRATEETLQQKDKERSEMLEHFRTLTVEATQLGSNNLTLESEARSTKSSLRNAESKIADLEHIIQNKDSLVSSYLEQIDLLTKDIARLETQVHNLTDQRDRLQAELDSCELLCSTSDHYDDPLSKTKFSGRKLGEELYRLKTENERLQKYLSKEKMNVSTLEQILSETRNEMEHNLSVTELQDEIRGLKANIKCLQEALESTSRQLRHTQHEASEYQRQIVELNRDLRNLQFENIRNTTDHCINYSTL